MADDAQILVSLLTATRRLRDGIAHHDLFGAQPDDAAVMIMDPEDDTAYELPHNEGQFSLGDLRDLLAGLKLLGFN